MLFFYSLALAAVLTVGAPWWLFRMATSGRYREGLGERLGGAPRRVTAALDGRPVIWIHAVSVGEVIAATGLVRELESRLPGHRVLVSTTTRTGQQLARQRFGTERAFYFPLDFAFAVRRNLRSLRPALVILVETEFWPRMLAECRRAGVPVAVVNARISDRSLPRYLRLRRLWKRMLAGVSLLLAQSEQDVERLRAIGAPADRVLLGGNLKYDVAPAQPAAATEALAARLPAGTPLIICGSTLDGEEQALIALWPDLLRAAPETRMVLAPRHPERFAAVAALLDRSGLTWARRSEWLAAPAPLAPGSILLLDSIGELASVYSLAAAAFVGGSLVSAGGHNPLEPAQYGVPVVMGPHYENFRAIVERLLAGDGIRIAPSSQALGEELTRLLIDPAAAAALGSRGLAVFRSEAGATARAAGALIELLEPGR